jgi:hypothetical protein
MTKPEHKYGPINKFAEEDKLLKGFIWKPKERPKSKEEIIHPIDNYPAKKVVKDKSPAKATGKKGTGKKGGAKAGQGANAAAPVNPATPVIKAANDSLQKLLPGKMQDSLKKVKDTTVLKKGNVVKNGW